MEFLSWDLSRMRIYLREGSWGNPNARNVQAFLRKAFHIPGP